MTTVIYTPSLPLNRYVECLWHTDGHAIYTHEKILPSPTVTMMFNFGAPFHASEPDNAGQITRCADSWIDGLRSNYLLLESPPEMCLMAVCFKPGGAYPFLKLPISEMHNQIVSMDAIWGHGANEIRERLYQASSVQARFALLECLLLERLRAIPDEMYAVQYAVREMAHHRGAVSIRGLSECMGISQKHLIVQFKRLVGATPKALARVYRFRQVLHSIDLAKSVDWTRIAHQSDYYDQSHFNKDFEAYTGLNPSEYLTMRRRVAAENPEYTQYVSHLLTG